MALSKRTKKYVNIVLLVLIAAGFTLPGALYFGGSDNSNANNVDISNQRVCQSDSECYLTCDTGLRSVLCSQNLCTVNSCEEESIYEFSLTPAMNMNLEVIVNGESLELKNLTREGDFFVTFSGDNGQELKLYSDSLSLNQILEKVGLSLIGNCLNLGNEFLCGNDINELSFIVNGEERYEISYYVPADGDEISIVYG